MDQRGKTPESQKNKIPPGVCCECCVLSGRGLCDGLVPRPECGVSECDREASKNEAA
jgi:hypothetical protein